MTAELQSTSNKVAERVAEDLADRLREFFSSDVIGPRETREGYKLLVEADAETLVITVSPQELFKPESHPLNHLFGHGPGVR